MPTNILRNSIKMALVVAAGVVLTAAPAKAQFTYNNANGDFLLGFRQVGSTNSVLLDLGPIANLNVSQSFSLGNLGMVLSSTFGMNWATDPNVFFSIAGTTRPQDPVNSRINYVTAPQYSGSPAVPWNQLTFTNSLNLQNKIIAMGNQYNAFASQQTPGNRAVVESMALAPDGYREYHPGGTSDAGHASGGISFGFFNPTTEGNFGSGVNGVSLGLVQMTPGSGPGTILGFFSLSADGSMLNYTAIPEPSTYALSAVGAIAFFIVLRRRNAKLRAAQA